MKKLLKLFSHGIAVTSAFCFYHSAALSAEEMIIKTPLGNSLTIDIDPEATFREVLQLIQNQIGSIGEASTNSNFIIDFTSYPQPLSASTGSGQPIRDYNAPVNAKEKEKIRYILTTLAKSSWSQLLSDRSSLKKAGDRIDHIHPLQFLGCIFSDKELKGCVHSIRDRSLVWGNFYDGLAGSLETESNRNNMTRDMVNNFAAKLQLNPAFIWDSIQGKRWSEFVDLLLKYLPREGNPSRYDM